MSTVFIRSLGALVGGLFLLGDYFWLHAENAPQIERNTGFFVLAVGAAGLLYWYWRRRTLHAK